MPLTEQPKLITDQLNHTIKEMADFLLSNSSDANYYKTLYDRIEKLSILVEREGYVGYKHENPHRTLDEFLSKNINVSKAVVRYYSTPRLNRVVINPSSEKKKKIMIETERIKRSFLEKIKKIIEWVFDQLGKIKPDIHIKP